VLLVLKKRATNKESLALSISFPLGKLYTENMATTRRGQVFVKIFIWWLFFSLAWGAVRLLNLPEFVSEVIAKPSVWVGITFIFFALGVLPKVLRQDLRRKYLQTQPWWRIFLLPAVFIVMYFWVINFRNIHLPAFSWQLLATTLVINFATAIVEEYIYRGVMYVWLLKESDEITAFAVVQVLFLLGHLPVLLLHSPSVLAAISHAFFILFIGAIHTVIFRLNKSLYSSILSHGIWNSLGFYLLLLR
jgi:membrane protease YdiL (CAAX protease family)